MTFRLARQNQHQEHSLQEDIICYLRTRWCVPIDTDVMDGIKFAPSDIARIKYINMHKSRGYIKGQPDIVLLLPRGKVALIELKTKSGRQSPEQKVYQTAVENLGHFYTVWRSVADAEKFFKSITKDDNFFQTGKVVSPLAITSPSSKDNKNGSATK